MKKVLKRLKKKDVFRFIGSVFFLVFAVTFPLVPTSCKLTDEGFELVESIKDTEPPTLVSFKVLNSEEVELEFSENMILSNLSFSNSDADSNPISISQDSISLNETKTIAKVKLNEKTKVGGNYVFKALVSDISGNTCDFEHNFIGFNDNPAKIVLTEVRNKASKNSKAECLEFYVLKSGNLAGLSVKFGYYSKKYDFPCIEVKKGEYIALHLKSYGTEEEGFVDELDDNLTFSNAKTNESSPARDLWISGTDLILSQSDVIAVVDEYTGFAVDGISMATSDKKSWTRANQKDLVNLLNISGVWNGADVEFSANTDNSSPARTLSRKNLNEIIEKYSEAKTTFIPNSKEEWIVAVKDTIGTENCTEKYIKNK